MPNQLRSYVVTVHHKVEYRQIDVWVRVTAKALAGPKAIQQVRDLGAPGPWRATRVVSADV
ncbi:MAG: hypothetical protein LC798_13075 [Chloroflexi bacterium]|nr:hypothetical protein [Chloroflexota bacterium]